MIDRNGERFYTAEDVSMDKVHAAMTEVGQRLTAAQFPEGDEDAPEEEDRGRGAEDRHGPPVMSG